MSSMVVDTDKDRVSVKCRGAGAGWTGGKVRSPECRVRRAGRWVKCRPTESAG